MTCGPFQILMVDALKSRFPGPELKAHLVTCPACREEFSSLQRLWVTLVDLPDEPASPALRLKIQSLTAPRVERSIPLMAWWGSAAGLLLAGGFLLGAWAQAYPNSRTPSPGDAALAMLGQSAPAGRIAGIALVAASDHPKESPVPALLDLVARDPNQQVRLAAVEALYLFGEETELRTRLGLIIGQQKDPVVQMALIDLMVALREKKAGESLRRLLREGHLVPEVRHRAQQRLAELPA